MTYPTIINYDSLEYLEYTGRNNGCIFDFNEYTIGDDDELVFVDERRLTKNEIRHYTGGAEFIELVEAAEEE